MQKILLTLLASSSFIGFSQTSVKKCEEKFNASIIKAAKKVSNLYAQKIEEAVAAGDQQEAERLMKELQDHKQKVKTIVKSARYNPKELPEIKTEAGEDELGPATTNTNQGKVDFDENKIIKFRDKVLENIARDLYNLEDRPIKVSDINRQAEFGDTFGCDDLNFGNKKPQVKDISDLKYFTGLNVINLQYHKIKNIDVITQLTNLKEIDLANNKITSIPSLQNLRQLVELRLSNNPLRSLKGIETAPELRFLHFSECNISDWSILKKLPNLKSLDVQDAKVSDISFINDCPALTSLILISCDKTTFKGSAEKVGKRLNLLFLHDTKLSSTSFLRELKQLTELELVNCHIKNIDFLKEHKKLHFLNLMENSISDLSVLKTMYENGCFQSTEKHRNLIHLSRNNLNLKPGAKNREIIDFLLKNDVNVKFTNGNKL